MRFFSYDPAADSWVNRASYGQWNTVARQGDRFFVGGYGGGFLLEWDPAQEWVATEKGKEGCNPQWHTQCTPPIHRPHDLLAHPDGKTLVLAGTPGYGYTGGGLLFWDAGRDGAAPPDDLARRFPRAQWLTPLVLPQETGAAVAPARVGVGFVPPTSDR